MKVIFSHIFRLLFRISITCVTSIGVIFLITHASVLANPDNFDINTENFTINLSNLDPIQHGPKADQDNKNRVYEGGWKGLFQKFTGSISNLLLMLIPLLAGISLIIAGYFYIFSFSDGEMQSKAKNIIKYNIFALFVGFLSYVIISIIASFLKF